MAVMIQQPIKWLLIPVLMWQLYRPVLCSGMNTAAVNFTGSVSGTTYNWTNTNANIGLPATGSGNSFVCTAINNNVTTSVATISINPVANGCPGNTVRF